MRILIIKPSSFGDIVHGLLIVERIRSQLPEAIIDWVARDIFEGLVESSDLVRRVHRFERSPRGFLRVIKSIRQEKYDFTLDLQGLARSGLMTFFSRSKMKIGRFDAREGARFFYGSKVLPPKSFPPFHAVDLLRQFQRSIGLNDLDPSILEFPQSPTAPEAFDEGIILLFPESRRAEKEWSGFVDLALSLGNHQPDRPIAWMGTSSEPLPSILTELPHFIDGRGLVTLDCLPSVMRKASVVIANDSGPVHLAASMGRPVVAIFGPTDPVKYGPYPLDRESNHVVRAPNGDLATLPVSDVENKVLSCLS